MRYVWSNDRLKRPELLCLGIDRWRHFFVPCRWFVALPRPHGTCLNPLGNDLYLSVCQFSIRRHFIALVVDRLQQQTVAGRRQINCWTGFSTFQQVFTIRQNQFRFNIVQAMARKAVFAQNRFDLLCKKPFVNCGWRFGNRVSWFLGQRRAGIAGQQQDCNSECVNEFEHLNYLEMCGASSIADAIYSNQRKPELNPHALQTLVFNLGAG